MCSLRPLSILHVILIRCRIQNVRTRLWPTFFNKEQSLWRHSLIWDFLIFHAWQQSKLWSDPFPLIRPRLTNLLTTIAGRSCTMWMSMASRSPCRWKEEGTTVTGGGGLDARWSAVPQQKDTGRLWEPWGWWRGRRARETATVRGRWSGKLPVKISGLRGHEFMT